MKRRLTSWVCTPLFALSALLHALAIVMPGVLEPSPIWRHALFIGINGFFAIAFWLRPRWLLPVFALLVAQQLFSHGTFALELWSREHRVDAASVVVLIGLPIALFAVARESRER